MNSPHKILALSLSGIGNFLMHMPVFAALKQRFPHTHLTVWLAPRGTRILAANDANIDAVIETPFRNNLTGHLRQADLLHQHKFDTGLALHPNQLLKGAVYLYAAGIKTRISHPYPLGKNGSSTFLITVPVALESTHDIEQNLNLLKPLGIEYSQQTADYQLNLPAETMHQALALVAELALPNNKPLIAIHAGSAPGFLWKRWPIERFAALAGQLIIRHNAHILILGGPDEEDLKHNLKSLIANRESQVTTISSDLLTTAALIKQCALVVSNDSGLMHLSAATGTPTLGLFGPTDEAKIGPRGPRAHTLRAPGTKPVYDVNTNLTFGSKPHPTLRRLSIELVLTKVDQLLTPLTIRS